MFIKERKKPIALQKLEAMISRMSPGDIKLNIARKYAENQRKGYIGECKVDYFLRSIPGEFSVLNDVTLKILGKKIQIDSLLITSFAVFILEMKNLSGILTFDTIHRQFIREGNRELLGYEDPIVQVKNIHYHLKIWLEERGLGGLPIHYFIVFAERSTIFRIDGDEKLVREMVCYADEILFRLIELNGDISRSTHGKKRPKSQLIQAIMREMIDFDFDMLKEIGVNKNSLLSGVHCPGCGHLGMERIFRKWRCSPCNITSIDAHLTALDHYALLIDQEIKNEQCRVFLHLNTRHEAHHMLKSAGCTLKEGKRIWLIKR